jgi:hypothetical protein
LLIVIMYAAPSGAVGVGRFLTRSVERLFRNPSRSSAAPTK